MKARNEPTAVEVIYCCARTQNSHRGKIANTYAAKLQKSSSLFAELSITGQSRVFCLSGTWFSTKSALPLPDGVRELIGQNVIREVGACPSSSL